MKNLMKEEKGEFAIDAIFGITFFMVALIAVMFIALIARVQSNIQYALGQTAKEISGYYYLVDKMGLAAATAGTNDKTGLDNTIQSIIDFSGSAEDAATTGIEELKNIDFQDYTSFDGLSEGELKEKVEAAKTDFNEMKGSLATLSKDPKGQVKQVLSVFAKTAANRAISYYVAPFICKALMPKYLSLSNSDNIDDYYTAIGIDPDSVKFDGSEFLTDKRSIKVQITYQLELEKYTLGFVKDKITFRQVASTAAWVCPDEKNLIALDELKYK